MPSSVARERGRRRAAILLPSLSRADATSVDAIRMAEALRRSGWTARVFAGTSPPGSPAGTVSEAARFLDAGDAVTIYHSGARWDDGVALLGRTRGAIVVRDHNVTPPRFFAGISHEFVDAATVGVEQRATLARDPRVRRFLAASERNAGDLRAAGAPPDRVRVVPPFHPTEALLREAPDRTALARWQRRPAALFVGRIAPNKGHLRLLRVAAVHRELFGEPLPMRIVGAADPRLYRWTARLERRREEYGVSRSVELCGGVSAGVLKAAYLTASVFLCCSEHEGVCVPLIEATALGVPIVAAHEAGVADTLGDAGLVVNGDDAVLATAVHRLRHDADLRERLLSAQRARMADVFSSPALTAALEHGLEGL